ncbi:MAG: hypothetical protein HRT69_13310 [Flavobacteriaceae bacterium]|jgi:hypothetical protein|nr:hypothetical protein [Flavobacteriaceae bacterium]
MYIVKEIGLGKKVCNLDGVTLLSDSLSQKKLKRLHELNCEFIEYGEQQEREETEKPTEVPAKSKESAEDNGSSVTGRKQNNRKGTRKPKTN